MRSSTSHRSLGTLREAARLGRCWCVPTTCHCAGRWPGLDSTREFSTNPFLNVTPLSTNSVCGRWAFCRSSTVDRQSGRNAIFEWRGGQLGGAAGLGLVDRSGCLGHGQESIVRVSSMDNATNEAVITRLAEREEPTVGPSVQATLLPSRPAVGVYELPSCEDPLSRPVARGTLTHELARLPAQQFRTVASRHLGEARPCTQDRPHARWLTATVLRRGASRFPHSGFISSPSRMRRSLPLSG